LREPAQVPKPFAQPDSRARNARICSPGRKGRLVAPAGVRPDFVRLDNGENYPGLSPLFGINYIQVGYLEIFHERPKDNLALCPPLLATHTWGEFDLGLISARAHLRPKRRMGKSTLLERDLIPAAQQIGLHNPVFVSGPRPKRQLRRSWRTKFGRGSQCGPYLKRLKGRRVSRPRRP